MTGAVVAPLRYPAELAETVRWHDETITIRPIRAEDEAAHGEFVASLRPEDQRLRFFNARPAPGPEELARLTHIDYAHEMAFVAVRTRRDGSAQTLGVARAVLDAGHVDAELAIIVRSDMKKQGLGRLLLGRLIAFSSAAGTRRLIAFVLHENLAMRKLAKSYGFVVDAAACDAQALCFVLELQPSSMRP